MHGRTPPFTITSYRGGYLPIKMLLYIAMTHAWAYPPTMTSYMGGYLSIIMLLYIAMTHEWAYPPPPTMTSYGGGYLPIKMLLYIAMTHAGCALRLCTVFKNSDDIYHRASLGSPPRENPIKLGHTR